MSETLDTALGKFTAESWRFLRHTATAEPLQLRMMKRAFELLDGVDTLIDVGGNLGVYSIFLYSTGACRRAVAFEPSPRTFQEIEANFALNFPGADSGKVHNVAASDADGQARFDVRRSLGPGNRILARPKAEAKGEETLVRTARLDDIIPGGARDAILKMDVEGHEIKAMAGADRLISERCAFAQIECWAGFDKHRAQMKAFMAQRGFRLLCRIKGDHLFIHESRWEDAADELMETYYSHVDDANGLLERLAIHGVKADLDPEISERAVKLFNGFDRMGIGAWRRRIDGFKGKKKGG